MTKEEKLSKLNGVFSPTQPIKQMDFFAGRISQLKKVCDAINTVGEHAIVYGERGVGKTSLANTMVFSVTNVYTAKVTCNRRDDFKSLWINTFKQIRTAKTTNGIGFKTAAKTEITSLSNQLENIDTLRASDVEDLVNNLPNQNLMFVFDEFDNVSDSETRSGFADLIKSLSDNSENTTIVIVGISDTIEKLIGEHPSLERCLKQIKMPRMSDSELSEIITKGMMALDIEIKPMIINSIVELSAGFPHYTHLLCKYGAKEIIENNKTKFTMGYLKIALKLGIENTAERLRNSFREATFTTSTTSQWKDVLYACAQAECDDVNSFSIKAILKRYNHNTGKRANRGNIIYNIGKFCKSDRGSILEKIGSGKSITYRFCNPMMKAFVKIKINSDGL